MQFIDKIVLKEKLNFILKDSNVTCKVRVILVIFRVIYKLFMNSRCEMASMIQSIPARCHSSLVLPPWPRSDEEGSCSSRKPELKKLLYLFKQNNIKKHLNKNKIKTNK
jgi:hypothetical protein